MTDTLVSQGITLTSIRTKTADHGVKSMKRGMLASLEKRYENLYTCPHYVICTLLDARFKDLFFTDIESAREILEEAYTRYAPVTASKSLPPEHGIWDYIAAKSGVEKPLHFSRCTNRNISIFEKETHAQGYRPFDVLERTCGYLFSIGIHSSCLFTCIMH